MCKESRLNSISYMVSKHSVLAVGGLHNKEGIFDEVTVEKR